MTSFRRAGHDRVNAFQADGTYLFTQYFEDEAVFAELTELYNGQKYPFEVAPDWPPTTGRATCRPSWCSFSSPSGTS